MNRTLTAVNKLLVEVFNDISKIEEEALKKGPFNDLSITEVHTIKAIGMYVPKNMSEVAKKLDITVGTLTVAVNNLVKKGYVNRSRREDDRRVVLVTLTNKGRLLFRAHEKFYSEIIKAAAIGLSEHEAEIFKHSLEKVNNILTDKYKKLKRGEAYV